MIYITGDTHGEHMRFMNNNMKDENWTKDDYLIICGDFGYIFKNNEKENEFLDYLENKNYTICFCDGNHENFPAIYDYPQEKWHGGLVHKIRKNIFHLMRGQVFEICEKKIFTMGGAYSIDRFIRMLNVSYWEEEIPNNEEYKEAIKNLEEHNKCVDIIITHTAPREIICRMRKCPDHHDLELTGFLEWIMYEVNFNHWYFGHWHLDEDFYDKFSALYYDIHQV